MSVRNVTVFMGLGLVAQQSVAGTALGLPLGLQLGLPLGLPLSTALPFGLGGAAGIAVVALVIGTQLINRRKK